VEYKDHRVTDLGITASEEQQAGDRQRWAEVVQEAVDEALASGEGLGLPAGTPKRLAATTAPPPRRAPPAALFIPADGDTTQTWTADRLVLRHGPLEGAPAPKLRVEFLSASGEVLESTEALPLKKVDDHGHYELWLIGPRVGYSRARIGRLA